MATLNGLSLFANIGIGEFYTEYDGSKVRIVVASEMLQDRANFYRKQHKKTNMIQGDITITRNFERIIAEANRSNVDMVMATPPCQGMSQANTLRYDDDPRNTLIGYVVRAVEEIKPRYCVIENVTNMANTDVKVGAERANIIEFIIDRLGAIGYRITIARANAADYGMPQERHRVTVQSLESGCGCDQL